MRCLLPALAILLLPAAAPAADPGCGDAIVRDHAGLLAPWAVQSVEPDPAGLVTVLARPDGDARLLIGMRVEPRGLVTFQSLHRDRGLGPVPPDANALLGPFWDAVDADPRSRRCLDLAAGQGLPDTASFAALNRATDRLQPPQPGETVAPPSPEAPPEPGQPWAWAGRGGTVNAALAYAALLGPAGLVFLVLRRRERGRRD